MNGAQRDAFTAFVTELARRLHDDKRLIAVDVYPKMSEPGAWDGPQSQDWKRLGREVDQFRIMTAMDEAGEELAAIFHSHTKSPAYPSQTDINLAAYPGVVYLIASLAEGEVPLRGFEIEDGEVSETELTIE